MVEPPRLVGTPRDVELTGKLCPWQANGQPLLIEIDGADALSLPVFSTEAGLRAALDGIEFDSIKRITDGPEFLRSIPGSIDVIIDLQKTAGGKVRYAKILRG